MTSIIRHIRFEDYKKGISIVYLEYVFLRNKKKSWKENLRYVGNDKL